MISVAVRGYGIVIWDEEQGWRTFSASESMSAVLASRVEMALSGLEVDTEDDVAGALLSLPDAHLLARSCEHGPGGCDEDIALN